MTNRENKPIIVVGSGWAGLSAAYTLAQNNQKVVLLEAAPKAGGRARAVLFEDIMVDNGQHLLLGAYEEILKLLHALGIKEADVLERLPLDILMIDIQDVNHSFQFQLKKLPFFLQFLYSLFSLKGATIIERLRMLQFCAYLIYNKFKIDKDIPVKTLLEQHKQSKGIIKKFWKPIALATLSTPIEIASSKIFLFVLQKAFFSSTSHSDWLIPKTDLSTFLPNAILKYLNQKDSQIIYNQRVQKVIFEEEEVRVFTNQAEYIGSAVILATPPNISAQILKNSQNEALLPELIQKLQSYKYQPITTLYLRYSQKIHLKKPLLGLINSMAHWVFERVSIGQDNMISIVITGNGPHTDLSHHELIKKITDELATLDPLLKSPLAYKIICEKKAAFSCEVGIEALRLNNCLPLPQLGFAGDYIENEFPATLEGAVRSGIKVATLLK